MCFGDSQRKKNFDIDKGNIKKRVNIECNMVHSGNDR